MPPAWTDPCNGHFTHEQTKGKCPLEIVAANRVVAGGRRTASLAGVLPSSLQDAVSTSDLAYLNCVDHTSDIGFDFDGGTVQELLNAAKTGVVAAGEAMAELAGRIPSASAEDQTTLKNTISALESLVKVGQLSKNPAQLAGNMLRLWSCATKKMKKLSGPIIVVDGDSLHLDADGADGDRPRSAKFSVERMSSESLFDSSVYQWSLLAHTLGIMSFEISAAFVFDTVHMTRVRHGETFWTAQEYFIACLDAVDQKKVKADKVPQYDRNVMLADARRFGEMFAAKASGSGPSGAKLTKTWNGEFQDSSKSSVMPCPYFNNGKDHEPRHLTSTGKCIFRHVCNHWVSSKGPGGRCESPHHSWKNCDNADKCDKKVV